jgi:DNA gyrase subunit A
MVINKSGITIRIGVDTLREMGRATQGVKIIRLRDDDSIASVAKVSKFKEEEETLLDEDGNPIVSGGNLENETENTLNSSEKTEGNEENNNETTKENEE